MLLEKRNEEGRKETTKERKVFRSWGRQLAFVYKWRGKKQRKEKKAEKKKSKKSHKFAFLATGNVGKK